VDDHASIFNKEGLSLFRSSIGRPMIMKRRFGLGNERQHLLRAQKLLKASGLKGVPKEPLKKANTGEKA